MKHTLPFRIAICTKSRRNNTIDSYCIWNSTFTVWSFGSVYIDVFIESFHKFRAWKHDQYDGAAIYKTLILRSL